MGMEHGSTTTHSNNDNDNVIDLKHKEKDALNQAKSATILSQSQSQSQPHSHSQSSSSSSSSLTHRSKNDVEASEQQSPSPYTPMSRSTVESFLSSLYLTTATNLGRTVTDDVDKEYAIKSGSSLCFGEIMPSGVEKMLDARHLDAQRATVIYDLGMGIGRVAIQTFFQYPNVQKVVGIEISPNRTKVGLDALQRLYAAGNDAANSTINAASSILRQHHYNNGFVMSTVQETLPTHDKEFMSTGISNTAAGTSNVNNRDMDSDNVTTGLSQLSVSRHTDASISLRNKTIRLESIPPHPITSSSSLSYSVNAKGVSKDQEEVKTAEGTRQGRILEFRRGDLFVDGIDAIDADIIILQTAFYPAKYPDLVEYLNKFKSGTRMLSYENLATVYGTASCPWKSLPADVYEASWCMSFHFHCYVKQ
jgi:hypothetical protein